MDFVAEALSYLYPVLDIACAVAIGVAFRGSLGGVLGPIGFGLSATLGIVNRLANYFVSTNALEFSSLTSLYSVTSVLGLLSGALIVAALLTGRTPAAGGVAAPVPNASWGTAAAPSAAGTGALGPVAAPANLGGFNWGAAGLTPLWLLFHGEIPLGLLLIAINIGFSVLGRFAADSDGGLVVVLLTAVIGYAIAIGFGVYGNKIAWKHHKIATIEELHRKERGWTIAGAIVFALVALLNVVGIVVLVQVSSY